MDRYWNRLVVPVGNSLKAFRNKLQRVETDLPSAKKYFLSAVIAGAPRHLPIEGHVATQGQEVPFGAGRWNGRATLKRIETFVERVLSQPAILAGFKCEGRGGDPEKLCSDCPNHVSSGPTN